MGKGGREKAAGRIFARVQDIVFIESTFGGYFLNELVVVTGNAQGFCHFFADGAASAANSRLMVMILCFISKLLFIVFQKMQFDLCIMQLLSLIDQ